MPAAVILTWQYMVLAAAPMAKDELTGNVATWKLEELPPELKLILTQDWWAKQSIWIELEGFNTFH